MIERFKNLEVLFDSGLNLIWLAKPIEEDDLICDTKESYFGTMISAEGVRNTASMGKWGLYTLMPQAYRRISLDDNVNPTKLQLHLSHDITRKTVKMPVSSL